LCHVSHVCQQVKQNEEKAWREMMPLLIAWRKKDIPKKDIGKSERREKDKESTGQRCKEGITFA
jgi:hypothetical protein